MKIAILTLPLNFNYGGILQAYALQKVLMGIGHEVDVVDPPSKRSYTSLLTSYIKYWIKRYIFSQNITYFKESERLKLKEIQELKTRPFISKYIKLRRVPSLKKKYFKVYDAIIVGSDQVWRKRYFTYFFDTRIENAFLQFTNDLQIKRVAYAASFGAADLLDYTNNEIERCKVLLSHFDHVSVREVDAVNICFKMFGRSDACHVLDPTLLLDKAAYSRFTSEKTESADKKKIMSYILDMTPQKRGLIEIISTDKNMEIFQSNIGDFDTKPQPPVESWLQGFVDASFVVTDSFHACVFSIIFHKPFVVFGNERRGESRILSLLEMFGLEKHLIKDTSEYDRNCSYVINETVYSILDRLRSDSLAYLQNCIQ